MAATTPTAVGTSATPLPASANPLRRQLLVENLGATAIHVGYSSATLSVGVGHLVAAGTSRTFPGGAPMWGICSVVNGVVACSLQMLCTDEAESTATCDVAFSTGDDLHLTVTASECSALPVGVSSASFYFQ